MIYEPLTSKDTLEKLKVDDCKECGHPTLMFKISPGVNQCLTCGTMWHLEEVKVQQEGRP